MSTDSTRSDIRIGTQGWNYPAWVGPFFPYGTRAVDFLETYARAFDTVEVDSTFYAIPPASTIAGWCRRTPAHFRFALKLPQEITHERRFVDARDVLDQFTDRARELGERLGPILIQCGPDFSPAERGALESFLAQLPGDIAFAIEFREPMWLVPQTIALLRAHSVALALSDGKWIPRERLLALSAEPTANFSYVRWMGPNRLLTDYSRLQVDRSAEIAAWAEALPILGGQVQHVYAFMNNHFAGHAPASARMMQQALHQPVVDPSTIGEQGSLF